MPEHVQEVVRQDSHKQPSLIGCEVMATGLVPTQRVLSLFDPDLHVTSTVVDLDHLRSLKPRIRDNESDPRKKFSRVPLDLRNHSALSIPRLCLIRKVNQLDLNPTLGGPSHRTC